MAGHSRALFSSTSTKLEYLVGGKTDAWQIPSSESDSLNKWAESSRFLIGDSLVWKYDGEKDSVLQVSKKGYVHCNTSSPIAESGPFYFISGAEGHCMQGQKMIVVVMSAKHRSIWIESPAIAPTSGAAGLRRGLLMALSSVVAGILVFM
ncbi:hypothetical protein NMG60_11001782 [Bertholletia excelsa]